KRIQIQKNWGDFRRGIWSALIQFSLHNLARSTDHSIAWRPSLLLISRDLIAKQKLIQVAFGVTKRSGFLTCINLYKTGEFDAGQLEKDSFEFNRMLQEKRINAFYRNAVVDHYLSGQLIASQLHGIGEFRHNTILLDWTEATGRGIRSGSSESVDQFRLIRFYSELNNSLMLLNVNRSIQRSGYQAIDVWWDPAQKNGSFMLVLAHLLVSSRYWGESKLHIKTVVLKDKLEQTRTLLEELVNKSRIRADISVIHPDSDQELSLGIQFERSQKKHHRQQKWLTSIRSMIRFSDRDVESERQEPVQTDDFLPRYETEDFPEEPGQEEEGDDAIKAKLSEQVQDRDIYIINKNINKIIIENSRHADLVMLGFNIPSKGKEKKYIEKMEALLEELPDTLLVNSPFDFELFD
ncbi:MAG: hypothetical protein U9N53_04015, partial [Bacteroidota bacterium]|nr:hypothetical protein [Bacteroidota bacterium]